jgi:phage N-6-adenine-methyltransferase
MGQEMDGGSNHERRSGVKIAKAEPLPALLNKELFQQYLAACETPADAKALRDQAAAAEKYLKARRHEMDEAGRAAIRAADLKLRAERRVGELLKAMAERKVRAANRRPKGGQAVTLSEMGIDKKTAQRWQQAAAVPAPAFEQYVAKCEAANEAPTSAGTRALLHTSSSTDYDGDEWYTPANVIEAVRAALGGEIDLDPASNNHAQKTVNAGRFFTKQTNALTQEWGGRVFCNPPYSMPLVQQFTDKLIAEFDLGRVSAAVYLVNNCTDAAWFQSLLRRFPVCFTAGRIKFENKSGVGFATRQGQALFALGAVRFAPLETLGTVVSVYAGDPF